MKTTLQKLSKHLFIGVVLIFTLCNHVFAQTIPIASASDLAKIGIDVAYPLDGDYKQTADIDLSGFSNWTPIGTFTGTYDGQYHSIDHLTITYTEDLPMLGMGKSYQGLFSELSATGQLKNLYLKNVNINLEGNSSNIGALVGRSFGQIYRVAVLNGTIRAYYIVGGLAGGQVNNGIITECYANVTIQDNGYIYNMPFDPPISDPGSEFGGLLGVNQNGAQVNNSYATGNVTGAEDVGGLVGYNTANSSISKSYASGAVSAPNNYGGGLVGLNGGNGNDCYWNITTSGQTNASWSTPNIASGKTDAQMKQQATFAGWDFTNVWKIENGVSQPSLRWMSLAPLPVSLVSFKAHTQAESIKLTWQTASESINKEFIIYRSGDQKEFELLTKIAGAGNATSLKSYNYYDEHPLAGNNYYKLAQVDENGKETELSINTAYFGFSETAGVQIFPNPVEDKVNVLFGNKKYTDFSITDLSGKILQKMPLKKDDSGLSTSLKNYAPGIYLFHFNGEDGSVSKKIIKK